MYTKAGGSQMNAFTNQDMTVYFVTVPANKVELWFWMESDRLANPVFREFYSERDVVHEERRLRTESTPTGKFDELFDAMFWESHPYSWPVVGWPSDLKTISKAEADAYFDTYYAPNNITAALVGNFDTAEVKALAQRYFGRLKRGQKPPPDVGTLEMPQLAEKRMRPICRWRSGWLFFHSLVRPTIVSSASRASSCFGRFLPSWSGTGSRMLPLVSSSRPMETGASTFVKCVILCSTPSSNSRKFSLVKLVTEAPSGVVTLTGIRTSGTSTRRSARGLFGLARGTIATSRSNAPGFI